MYHTEVMAPLMPTVVRMWQWVVETMWESTDVGGERVVWTALDRRVQSGDYLENFGIRNRHTTPLAHNATAIETIVRNTRKFF